MKKLYFISMFLTGALICGAQDYVQLRVQSATVDYLIDATFGGDDNLVDGPPTDMTGELVVANDGISGPADNDEWNVPGSYCCDTIMNGEYLDGKIAFISRGSCSFFVKTEKVFWWGATAAIIWNRAPLGTMVNTHNDGLITMTLAGIDPVVDIPSYFITHEDGIEIMRLMDEGPVTVTFETPSMYDAVGPYAYATPVSQIRPLEDISVVTLTRDRQDTLMNVTFSCVITDPSSNVTTLTTVVDLLPPGIDPGGVNAETLVAFDSYTPPAEVGVYTMEFSAATADGGHPLDETVITKTFEITDNTFAMEDGTVADTDGIQLNYYAYSILGDGVFNMGSFYRTPNAGSATFASFAIGNVDEIFDNGEFEFGVNLYDADADNDGIIDDLFYEENPIAEATYEMTGDEGANELIVVEFEAPGALEAGGIYCVMIDAGDQLSFTDNQPAFSTSGDYETPLENTFVLMGTEAGPLAEPDGLEYWNDDTPGFPRGGRHAVIRLHLDGFVGLEDFESLSTTQFNLFPAIADQYVNMQLDLNSVSEKVQVNIFDIDGKLQISEELMFVLDNVTSFNTSSLASGTYLMSVTTEEGAATRKFVVRH